MPHVSALQILTVQNDTATGGSSEPDAGLTFCFQLAGAPPCISVEPPAACHWPFVDCVCIRNFGLLLRGSFFDRLFFSSSEYASTFVSTLAGNMHSRHMCLAMQQYRRQALLKCAASCYPSMMKMGYSIAYMATVSGWSLVTRLLHNATAT